MRKKCCGACLEALPVERFAFRSRTAKSRQSWCRDCRSAFDKARYESSDEAKRIRRKNDKIRKRNQDFIYGHLMANPCVACGEDDLLVLDFDHVRGEKQFNVTAAVRNCYSIEKIKAEIAKCVIRCANCHRKKTLATSVRARYKNMSTGV